MNELQTALSQFKQGLGQVVFYHHGELKKVTTEENAVSFVAQELESLTDSFRKLEGSGSLFSVLNDLEKEWNKKLLTANEEKRYDEILHAEDILKAIKVIKLLPKED